MGAMTNPAEKIRQVLQDFIKHNKKVHVIKFSIFPRTHEKRRKEFRKYIYKLDKQYQQNLADCYLYDLICHRMRMEYNYKLTWSAEVGDYEEIQATKTTY